MVLDDVRDELVQAGKFVEHKGWAPGGHGGLSIRFQEHCIASSDPDAHLGRLQEDDIFQFDISAFEEQMNSEAYRDNISMHAMIYLHDPDANAVAHVYPMSAMRVAARYEDVFSLPHFLMPGIDSKQSISILRFEQTQEDFLETVGNTLRNSASSHAILVKNGGLLVWGPSLLDLQDRIDLLDFVFQYSLAENE